ncbi:MAG: hypothetical protein KF708_14365 [Pirellulales bacterium]|nr:hypothetical protein [Pirellulales bacterium]
MNENLSKQLGRVQLLVAGGRIVAQAPQLGGRITSNSTNEDRSERLTIEFTGTQPTFEYELTTATEQILAQVHQGERITLRRLPRSNASEIEPMSFVQEIGTSLELRIGADGQERVHRSTSLWYLLMDEPDACREHLVPLLEMLRPDWRLMQTAQEIEEGMIRAAQSPSRTNREQWSQLVAQLGSDAFAERRAADRLLRQVGQAIIPYLDSLDSGRLDAEQRFRIRRIVGDLANDEAEDLPARVMQSAAADPRAWLTLLDRPDESLRRLALAQMQELLGEPLEFDPAGEVAQRDEQIAQLRTRFERPSPSAGRAL